MNKDLTKQKKKIPIGKYIIFVFLIVLCVVLSLTTKGFLTQKNIINVLRQVSYNGVIAVGMTFVIITGNIDLSVGSVVGYSAIVACSLAHPGEYPLIVPVLAAVGIGIVVGVVNGLGVAYGRIPAFVMTLGTQTILRGMVMLFNNGKPMLNLSESYQNIGIGYVGAIPVPVIILACVLIVGAFILNRTRFGRHVLAVGGNQQASRISGLNVELTQIAVFIISGICAAIAGLIISARVNAGSPTLGTGYEQDAIAASVIGGTSMMGGSGSILGTLGGILIIGVMNNGLDLLNVSSYYQQIAKGFVIILAVLIDMMSQAKRSK